MKPIDQPVERPVSRWQLTTATCTVCGAVTDPAGACATCGDTAGPRRAQWATAYLTTARDGNETLEVHTPAGISQRVLSAGAARKVRRQGQEGLR